MYHERTGGKRVMAKGTAYTQQFKEDAVRYKKEYPELSYQAAASNLNVSISALKSWIKKAKENDGEVPTRGAGNYSSDEAKEIARLQLPGRSVPLPTQRSVEKQ